MYEYEPAASVNVPVFEYGAVPLAADTVKEVLPPKQAMFPEVIVAVGSGLTVKTTGAALAVQPLASVATYV
jgi:hypothetical protein